MRSYVPSRLFAVLVVVFHTLSVCSAQSCGAAPEGTLRLTYGSTDRGTVEVCLGGNWGVICQDYWEHRDAAVICNVLGFSPHGALAATSSNRGRLPVTIIDLNCTGTEQRFADCPQNGLVGIHSCSSSNTVAYARCQALGVTFSNCTEGSIRLANGTLTSYSEGRLDVCINGVWGSVCYGRYTYQWSRNAATVVCRQLGHQPTEAVSSTPVRHQFAIQSGPIFLQSVVCSGSEQSLFDCSSTTILSSYCSTHYRDVGIRCLPYCQHGDIRFVDNDGTADQRYGRVEVCINGTWGTVYTEFWSLADASVACRQAGYSPYGAIAFYNRAFSEMDKAFFIIDVNCTGEEMSLFDCPHNNLEADGLDMGQDAAIRCEDRRQGYEFCSHGDLRLVGGPSQYEGIVEVCFNGVWGTVCTTDDEDLHSYFTAIDANVVCRQLGHQAVGATAIWDRAYRMYGYGGGPLFVTDTHCDGSEDRLLDCRYSIPQTRRYGACRSHSTDVGVRCLPACEPGEVRLMSDPGRSYYRPYGRVEVCLSDRTRGIICNQRWDNVDASVACRLSGFSQYGAIATLNQFTNSRSSLPFVSYDIRCNGNETSLLECFSASSSASNICGGRNNQEAGVYCQHESTVYANCSDGDLRFAGRATENSGRLEVCYNNAWGTICSESWGSSDTTVACRQLGFLPIGYVQDDTSPQHGGVGSGPIFHFSTSCSGSESALSDCQFSRNPEYSRCNHFDDISINCTAICNNGDVELSSTSCTSAGVINVCVNGRWGKVCGGELEANFASVVCRQLGFSPHGAIALRGAWRDSRYSYRMYQPECFGNETNIVNCRYNTTNTLGGCSSSSYDTSVICLPDGVQSTNCWDGDIRVSGYNLRNKGRVEICRRGVWGSVCRNAFNSYDLPVMCRMLGFNSSRSGITTSSDFTTMNSPPIYSTFRCSSDDRNLSVCSNPSGVTTSVVSTSSCPPSVALVLECPLPCNHGEIRTFGSGNAEVCISGEWGYICRDDDWDRHDADVICRQLGYFPHGSVALPYSNSGQPQGRPRIQSLRCMGDEASVLDCQYLLTDVSYCSYASVQCLVSGSTENCTNGDIRLVGGSSSDRGRIEVCINQTWSTTCDVSASTARVACRQLGITSNDPTVTLGGYYGAGRGPTFYYRCRGAEDSLTNCYPSISTRCSHQNDAGIECIASAPCMDGDLRLFGFILPNEGRVEVCLNNVWGTVCPDSWTNNDAAVVCQQLGFLRNGSRTSWLYNDYNAYRYGGLVHNINDSRCTGNETSFLACPRTTRTTCNNQYRGATVSCAVENATCLASEEGNVRLVDGETSYEGRVEVCHSGQWGTICQFNDWGHAEAQVVCRQLGLTSAGAYASDYRNGTGRINFYDVDCNGNEMNLTSCSYSTSLHRYCSHYRDAGVTCRAPCRDGDVQLEGVAGRRNHGRVEVCVGGSWGTFCLTNATNRDASVICRQVGYGAAGAFIIYNSYGLDSLSILIGSGNCLGSENSLFSCPYSVLGPGERCSSEAAVICQDPVIPSSNCVEHDIRLHPRGSQSEGYVQVCVNGAWGGICSGGISSGASHLMCAQLGYQPRAIRTFTTFPIPNDGLLLQSLRCSGYNISGNISQCSYQYSTGCNERNAAGLQCEELCTNNAIRLRDSTTPTNGRLQVCVNGMWKTICSDELWDDHDATVVCRQLGFAPHGAVAVRYSQTSYSSTGVSQVNCIGTEGSITNCPRTTTSSTCSSSRDAGVYCQELNVPYANCASEGEIRLTPLDSQESAVGRVEICINNVWFAIPWTYSWGSDYYQSRNPGAVCDFLGYDTDGSALSRHFYELLPIPVYPNPFSCLFSNQSLLDCINGRATFSSSLSTSSVAVSCTSTAVGGGCIDGDVRLSSGQYGRVEVCLGGSYGRICESEWSVLDASVVCRQIGYSPYGAFIVDGRNFRGLGYLPIKISSLYCNGTETSILNCPSSRRSRCSNYYRDTYPASAVCQQLSQEPVCNSGGIRLRGGPTPLEGIVELCYRGAWGPICSLSTNDARVACFQLGFQRQGATSVDRGFYGESTGIPVLNPYCRGTETSLFRCRRSTVSSYYRSCGISQYAAVQCLDSCTDGQLRLRNSFTSIMITYIGRVENCIRGQWTTICDADWDNQDASVVCRQLGLSPYGAIALSGEYYSEYFLQFGITDINCTGTEQDISSCPYNERRYHRCDTIGGDAGVICQDISTVQSLCTNGDVRLAGGSTNESGRVELCYNNVWGSVCSGSLSQYFGGNVVCRQLGYLPIGAQVTTFGSTTGPMFFQVSNFQCNGSEASLLQCNQVPEYYGSCNPAGVTCELPCDEGDIRLIESSNNFQIGLIEICVNGIWGTICRDSWGNVEASIACKQLGYSPYGAIANPNRNFQYSLFPIGIDNITCNGQETSLLDCTHSRGRELCRTQTTALVICRGNDTEYSDCVDGQVRLIGDYGRNVNEGTVEVCYANTWGTICGRNWGAAQSQIVCRQLGFSEPEGSVSFMDAHFGRGSGIVLMDYLYCRGSESTLLNCSWTVRTSSDSSYCDHSRDVGVRCAGTSDLTFVTEMPPPPILEFLNPIDNPGYSNGSLEFAWAYNDSEIVSTRCQLLTSSFVLSIDCANNNISLSNLEVGPYTLYIIPGYSNGSFAEEFIVRWTVDQSAPSVRITSALPSQYSNELQWTFEIQCMDVSPCMTNCSVHEVGNAPNFETCDRIWTATNFMNEDVLEFMVVGVDRVGNTAPIISHTWTVDTEAPNVTVLPDVILSCNENLSPAHTGTPSIADNIDTNPLLEYTDIPTDSCGILRVWTGTDAAGNTVNVTQEINILNPLPPIVQDPHVISVPCGSIDSIIANPLYANLSVIHPCERPTTTSYTPFIQIDRCNFTVNRTWLIQDDCGINITFQQTVHILDQQLPENPADRQVNVLLDEYLRWHQYPGAVRYRVYIWPDGSPRPDQATADVNVRRYRYPQLYPATLYYWQVEYVTGANVSVLSPIWSFETLPLPDLTVTAITLPPMAFSGQSFDVTWTVENIGNLSTGVSNWRDAVHISRFSRSSRFAVAINHRSFVDPQDGYTKTATVNLREREVGTYTVRIEADFYRDVRNEADRSNNWMYASTPIQIYLTPPPNLRVTSLYHLPTTFSGERINVQWTTTNVGVGVTRVDNWVDRVYMSPDTSLDTVIGRSPDRLLGSVNIHGYLHAGASYNMSLSVLLPERIYGMFYILVHTDASNQVYEHTAENDNVAFISTPLDITLAPPPDLVVSSILSPNVLITDRIATIEFNVSNIGAGPPSENYWIDHVMLTSITTGVSVRVGRTYHYGILDPEDYYTTTIMYSVPPTLVAGMYNLTVETDVYNYRSRGHVFEFDRENNNAQWTLVTVRRELPDLTIMASIDLITSIDGNRLVYDYTVVNSGRGMASLWNDVAELTNVQTLQVTQLMDYHYSDILRPGENYTNRFEMILPPTMTGNAVLRIGVDFYRRVIEENENNNIYAAPITVSPVHADLFAYGVTVNQNIVVAGSDVQVTWQVRNIGNGLTQSNWTDTAYIGSSYSMLLTRLSSTRIHHRMLMPGQEYNRTLHVTIPITMSGPLSIIIRVDDEMQLFENNITDNNIAQFPLTVISPPSPDLMVTSVTHSQVQTESNERILMISWTVANIGNSMSVASSWIDEVLLSQSANFSESEIIRIGSSNIRDQILSSNQEYTASVTAILNVNVPGLYYVYVAADRSMSLMELNGENNNIIRSPDRISIAPPPSPRLQIAIDTSNYPGSLTSRSLLTVSYNVTNIGERSVGLSSWTDQIYLSHQSTLDRAMIAQDGTFLGEIVHNRDLQVGEAYYVSTEMLLPYEVNRYVYIAVIVDVNGNLGDPAVIGDMQILHAISPSSFLVEDGPLPDLTITPLLSSTAYRSGEPATLHFQVINRGQSTASGPWYDTIYLSRNAALDESDNRLVTVRNSRNLEIRMLYNQTIDVFMPYNLPSGDYYLFFVTDVRDSVPEMVDSDNIADVVITIQATAATDIVLDEVSASPSDLQYGQDLSLTWNVWNNGSLSATGYKCDTAYLSEDATWDVTDSQLGEPICSYISLPPAGPAVQPNSMPPSRLRYMAVTATPFVAQDNYSCIVRTRTSIRDPDLINNIGTSATSVRVNAPTLLLGVPINVSISSGSELVYKVENVPSTETLIATLSASRNGGFHDLLLRYRNPPTRSNYDAFSQYTFSHNQTAIVQYTRSGVYYVRIESFGGDTVPYEVQIEVKIATFDILDVVPKNAAPLGNVTLRVSGTLIDDEIHAALINEETAAMIPSSATYWISSIEVYATFDVRNLSTGFYTVQLTNPKSNEVVQLIRRFRISSGIPGQISTQIAGPGTFPTDGGPVTITLIVSNIGNTDILTPIMFFRSSKNFTNVGLIDNNGETRPYRREEKFLALPRQGPAGVIPPHGLGIIYFRAIPIQPLPTFRERLNLDYFEERQMDNVHLYVGRKQELKPRHVPDDSWDIIWDNFLSSVGETWRTLTERMSDIATEQSMGQQRIHSVDDMVEFQLRIASGRTSPIGPLLISFEDVADHDPNILLEMSIVRQYSSYIHKRRTSGPMGRGWIIPMLEMSLTVNHIQIDNATKVVIELWNGRDLIEFNDIGSGVFSDGNFLTLLQKGNEIIYDNGKLGTKYIFDSTTGRLTDITLGVNNETISVDYLNQTYPSLFTHSNGKQIRITYNEGKVIFIDLVTEDGSILKSCVYSYSGDYLTFVAVGNRVSSYNYSSSGYLTGIQYASGLSRTWSYSENHLVTGTAEYNEDGDLLSSIEVTPRWNGRFRMTTLPQNRTTEILYNVNGGTSSFLTPKSPPYVEKISEISPGTTVKTYMYGDQVLTTEIRQGNEFREVDANGYTKTIIKGDNGEILSYTDGDGFEYRTEYNDDGFVSAYANPDGNKTQMFYDDAGHIRRIMNADETTATFTYDSDGRVVTKDIGSDQISYQYDGSGRMTQASNSLGRITFTYYEQGTPQQVTYPNGRSVYYGFNQDQQRTFTADNRGYNVTYQYNSMKQLVAVLYSSTQQPVVQFEYNSKGMLSRKVLGNGFSTIFTYVDGTADLSSITNFNANGTVVSYFGYEYDRKGQITKVATLEGNWTYSYDPVGQMVKWTNPQGDVTTYTYDGRGNRVVMTVNGRQAGYETNSMNQYRLFNQSDQFNFDANGNLIEKMTSEQNEKFVFNTEGKMIKTEVPGKNCSYFYDALSHPYMKNCTDGSSYQYVIDPYGLYGADIIAEINQITGEATYFLQGFEYGMLAAWQQISNSTLYYDFDMDGSVRTISSETGEILNSYEYDPFGRVLRRSERIHNNLQFLGRLGIFRHDELIDMYCMRERVYDAKHGRFISVDPMGLLGRSTNFYTYARNSPLNFKDPSGRILIAIPPFGSIILRSVAGAIESVVFDTAVSFMEGRTPTLQDILKSVASGAIRGPGTSFGNALVKQSVRKFFNRGLIKNWILPVLDGLAQDAIDGQSPDIVDAIGGAVQERIFGALFGGPEENMAHMDESGADSNLITGLLDGAEVIFKNTVVNKVTDFIDKVAEFANMALNPDGTGVSPSSSSSSSEGGGGRDMGDGRSDPRGEDDEGGGAQGEGEEGEEGEGGGSGSRNSKNIRRVISSDPNDMIGPSGYGDANFISPDEELEYTIRFENEPNATAPAQVVYVSHVLDSDLDIRTFRLGSFGFGSFNQDIQFNTAIVQEFLNLTSTLGVFVRIRAGIDVTMGEAIWEFLTIDPETGEIPDDPLIGFLPPNNGTTGQGFVRFRVQPSQQVEPLAQIDANASIIFDQNEPILTPPIFNTIDNSKPSSNSTIVESLLQNGTLAIQVDKSDTGSGVKKIDVYQLIDDTRVHPLVMESTSDVIVLPLDAGQQYKLFTIATDNVGNQQELDEAMDNVLTADYPVIIGVCPNDCSNRGNCTELNSCRCESGFYGIDCSQTAPVNEPPVLDLSVTNGTEDSPVSMYISAHNPGSISDMSSGLTVRIISFPPGSTFSRGSYNGEFWTLTSSNFGSVDLFLPSDLSGQFEISAEAISIDLSSRRVGTVQFSVQPVVDTPFINVVQHDDCIESETGQFTFILASFLVDNDGSETLTVIVSGMPNGTWLSVGQANEQGDYIIRSVERLTMINAEIPSSSADDITVTLIATATETLTNGMSSTNATISISKCVEVFDGCSSETDNTWNIRWPKTQQGTTTVQACPVNYIGNATRECSNDGEWSEPLLTQCFSVEFINLEERAIEFLSTADPREQLIQTSVVTRDLLQATIPQTRSLLPNDLQAITRVTSSVIAVLESNYNEAVTDAILEDLIDVFNNMLADSNLAGWRAQHDVGFTNGSEKFLNNVERYALVVASMGNVTDGEQQYMYRQRKSRSHIVVSTELYSRVPPATDLHFPHEKDLTNYTNRKDVSEIIIPQSLVKERLDEMNNDEETLPIFFMLMNNFPYTLASNKEVTTCDGELNITTKPASHVIGAGVGRYSRGVSMSDATMMTPVMLNFNVSTVVNGSNYRCVSWDYSNPIRNGSWVTSGVVSSEAYTSDDYTTLQCNSTHLGSFVALVDIGGSSADIQILERDTLHTVAYVGCAIAMLSLILTVIFFVAQGKKLFTSVYKFIHLNLALSILFSLIVFVGGIEAASRSTIGCKVTAALLHYFLLSSFLWMLCEAVTAHLLLVATFSKLSKWTLPSFLICYGLPIPIVAVTAGLRHPYFSIPDTCGNPQFCWLSVEEGTIYGFVTPALAIIFANVFILCNTLCASCKIEYEGKGDEKKARKVARRIFVLSVILLPLLALTWTFGLLTLNLSNSTVYVWLFAIFNILLGQLMFIFHVISSDKVWSYINPRLNLSNKRKHGSPSSERGYVFTAAPLTKKGSEAGYEMDVLGAQSSNTSVGEGAMFDSRLTRSFQPSKKLKESQKMSSKFSPIYNESAIDEEQEGAQQYDPITSSKSQTSTSEEHASVQQSAPVAMSEQSQATVITNPSARVEVSDEDEKASGNVTDEEDEDRKLSYI